MSICDHCKRGAIVQCMIKLIRASNYIMSCVTVLFGMCLLTGDADGIPLVATGVPSIVTGVSLVFMNMTLTAVVIMAARRRYG